MLKQSNAYHSGAWFYQWHFTDSFFLWELSSHRHKRRGCASLKSHFLSRRCVK